MTRNKWQNIATAIAFIVLGLLAGWSLRPLFIEETLVVTPPPPRPAAPSPAPTVYISGPTDALARPEVSDAAKLAFAQLFQPIRPPAVFLLGPDGEAELAGFQFPNPIKPPALDVLKRTYYDRLPAPYLHTYGARWNDLAAHSTPNFQFFGKRWFEVTPDTRAYVIRGPSHDSPNGFYVLSTKATDVGESTGWLALDVFDGRGELEAGKTERAFPGAIMMCVADFNRDSRIDLMIRQTKDDGTYTYCEYLAKGDGSFSLNMIPNSEDEKHARAAGCKW